jgi:hypothetical protein
MQRTDPAEIAVALLAAPGWARIGITAPTKLLREEAALELARAVIGDQQPEPSPDQLTLSL